VKGLSRRRFVQGAGLAGIGLLAACGRLPSQGPARVPRIGLHSILAAEDISSRVAALQEGLRELGYVEGKNLAVETRYGDGRQERGPELAAELVALNPDVLVTMTSGSIRPAMRATSTIPIVMVADNADPVAVGYVASLAHPGGNVTGLTGLTAETTQKRLQLLQEAVLGLSRVGVLHNPDSADREVLRSETEAAARVLGLQIQPLEARRPDELEGAFETASRERVDGLIVVRDSVTSTNRAQVAALAQQHRLPAMYATREFVDAGGLMVYASNVTDLYRRTATYVDKLLKGAKPADLPVERPTKFELVINLKAAEAIGLAIPQAFLRQATEVLQ
jgi:putative ABC transport system substrate-binding protein